MSLFRHFVLLYVLAMLVFWLGVITLILFSNCISVKIITLFNAFSPSYKGVHFTFV